MTHDLGQQRAVERESLGPLLSEREVALVEERADIAELQRARVRRREGGLDLDDADLAPCDGPHQILQSGKIEHILETLAVRLEHDRERLILARNLQQVRATTPLLPQRGAASRPPAREEQGTSRTFTEATGEKGRVARFLNDDILDVICVEEQQIRGGNLVDLGPANDDAVIGVDALHLKTQPISHSSFDRLSPR